MILIAPWGNPSGWGEADYVLEGTMTRSKTSLKPLKDAMDPERTLIIALDSLATEGRDYAGIRDSAESAVKGWAEAFGIEEPDVIIAPGRGRFGAMTLDGELMDCYRYLLAALSEYLVDNRDPDIVLDLTHGINFETVFTYRALRDALSVVGFFGETRLRVYNSDPFIGGARLQINEIENITVRPVLPGVGAGSGFLLKSRGLTAAECRDLSARQKTIPPAELSAFIGSFYNALPLALFAFAHGAEDIRDAIDVALRLYGEYTDVSAGRITRRVKLGEDFYPYSTVYILSALGQVERKSEVSLDEIKEVSEMFRSDDRFKVRIENEIEEIGRRCAVQYISDWELYNRVFSATFDGPVWIGPPDQRNFLAHSGFERNAFEVKSDAGVTLRYCGSALKTVMKYSASGLMAAEKNTGTAGCGEL